MEEEGMSKEGALIKFCRSQGIAMDGQYYNEDVLSIFTAAYEAATSQSQQEIASLRQQVAERDALLMEKDEALREYVDVVVSEYDHTDFSPKVADGGNAARIALSKTLPSEALERALAESEAKGMENAAHWYDGAFGAGTAVAMTFREFADKIKSMK
jgi:hypothetical protein